MSELPRHLTDLLFLVSYLRKHPDAHIRDVAKLLRVPPDDVLAYVNEIVLCGKPPFSPGDFIDIEISPHGRLNLALDQKLGRPLHFTPHEAIAISLALRTLAESKAERWSALARGLLEKMGKKLGEDVAKRVDSVEPRIAVASDAGEVETRLRALQRAQEERRIVEITYWSLSRDQQSTRRVHPLLTVDHGGTWYLVAHDERSNAERRFRLDRIHTLTVTEDRFAPVPGFDPKKYHVARMFLPGADVRQARVLLQPSVAPAFRDRWLPRDVTVRKTGEVEATIDYVSPHAIAAWILPYGAMAEVLDPPEVRDAVLERARTLRAQYA